VLPISVSESSLLRSPKASEGEGGALGEAEARKRGNTVGVRDQVMDLVASQGQKVSRTEVNLFPTPNTMDMLPARDPSKIDKSKGGYANVRETVINELMPTPMALDGEKGGLQNSEQRRAQGLEPHLPNVARDLLPTTSARDFKDGPAPRERDGVIQKDTLGRAMLHGGEVLLPTTRVSMANGATSTELANDNPKSRLEAVTNWGKFEPAIRRWEDTIGRLAPAPTKPDGKEGAHRLSSAFTEWMMGLPEGWITDVGLSRNAELKACGNGVVPQQAELALRFLLQGVPIPAGGGK
jgi:DNA (cytosine-5)-methyltransferase 1